MVKSNLKKEKRAREKMVLEYYGEARRLKDMLRGSILCKDMVEMRRVWESLQELERQGILVVVQTKNRFRGEAGPGGYRDINVNVLYEGFVCEVQVRVVLPCMLSSP